MSPSNIDLRILAVAMTLAPAGAFLMGPTVALVVGAAYVGFMVLALACERRTRIAAPGTEAGLSSLVLWAAAAILGLVGTVTVAVAWLMMA